MVHQLEFIKRHPRLAREEIEHLQTVRKIKTTPDIVYDLCKAGALVQGKRAFKA